MPEWELRATLVGGAQGEVAPDLLLQGGRLVNVYSGEISPANVAILRDRICYMGPEAPCGTQTQIVDCRDRYLCPGFIEPHTHPWVTYSPASMAAYASTRGTTTFAADNLLFWLKLGAAGFRRVVDECKTLPARFYWWVRSSPNCSVAEESDLYGPAVMEALEWPEVLGLSEIPSWPRLTRGEPRLLQATSRTLALGKRVDGHTAGASHRRLNALAAAGISSCHEAITGAEALDRLRLGYWTSLRFQSLRPDLPDLIAAVVQSGVDTRRLLLTQDAGSPAFLMEHGMIDSCVRLCIQAGLPPMQAIQLATINAATYLGLDAFLGGLAPGRFADIQVLPDLISFQPEQVYLGGILVAQNGRTVVPIPSTTALGPWQGPGPELVDRPQLYATPWTEGPVPVIAFASTAITRRQDTDLPIVDGRVRLDTRPDLCYCALIGEDDHWITRGVVGGLMHNLEGLATTALSGGGMLVLGRSPDAMALAARTVAAQKGGLALVRGGQVAFRLELPLLGYMSERPMAELAAAYAGWTDHLRALEYHLGDPGYSLDFLCADFLPDLRLTPRGLVDIKSGQVLSPPARF